MDRPDTESLIARYLSAYNAFDIDGMLALLSPQIRFENHSGGERNAATNGIDEFRALAESSKALFSQREQRVTKLALDGHVAVADIAYRGVLAVDVPGGPPAGTVLELQGQSEFSFEGGKISRIVDRS